MYGLLDKRGYAPMKYKVFNGDYRYIGSISKQGRVTDVSEGIGGINALQTLIEIFPDGFYVKKDEPRRWWR